MLFQGVLLITLVVLQVTNNTPLEDEKVEPVDLNYICINDNETEDQNKSPVLLIHGLGVASTNWKGVDKELSLRTHRKVCAIDLRNHGDSPWNNRADIPASVADIKHFLKKQNIEKVNIIGHSLGGKTAIDFALKYPQHVDSLVIEDMTPNGISEEGLFNVRLVMRFLKSMMKSVPEGLDELGVRRVFLDKMKKLGLDLEIPEDMDFIPMRCNEGKCKFKFNIDVYIPFLENPNALLGASEGVFEGPALFIYGKKSEFDVGGDKENILKLFPNAKLIGIEGIGHMIHGFSKEFDEEVIKFLNQ